MKITTLFSRLLFIVGCLAANQSISATVSGGSSGINISNISGSYSHIKLISSDANINLTSQSGVFNDRRGFSDGYYQYQIVVQKQVDFSLPLADTLNNGRDINARQAMTGLVVNEQGTFLIQNGQVVDANQSEKAQ